MTEASRHRKSALCRFSIAAIQSAPLISDLVEGLRAEVDAWALGLFNGQTLRADDFSTTQEGCFLGKAGRERFYRAWEPLAENLRKLMDAQTRTLIAMIGAGEDDASEADMRLAWTAWASQDAEPAADPTVDSVV